MKNLKNLLLIFLMSCAAFSVQAQPTPVVTWDSVIDQVVPRLAYGPALESIYQLEAEIILPPHSRPLGSYVRYYSMDSINGSPIWIGTFVYEDGHGRIKVVPKNRQPMTFDGGCSVITVKYAIQSHTIMSLECNGYA